MDFDAGLDAVEELWELVPEGASMAELALRWILTSGRRCTTAGSAPPIAEPARAQ
ncbi:MAG TPA: hypothetical protein VKA84_14000 [Gemmatimonadaceae bacterium]|nr:hypothetical protein [Gemmatimonadaceae bacterium]